MSDTVEKNETNIGRVAEMRTAQGQYHGVGKVIAYIDRPAFIIRTPAGQEVAWLVELCKLESESALSQAAIDQLLPWHDHLEPK